MPRVTIDKKLSYRCGKPRDALRNMQWRGWPHITTPITGMLPPGFLLAHSGNVLPSSSQKLVTLPLTPTKISSLQRQQNSF